MRWYFLWESVNLHCIVNFWQIWGVFIGIIYHSIESSPTIFTMYEFDIDIISPGCQRSTHETHSLWPFGRWWPTQPESQQPIFMSILAQPSKQQTTNLPKKTTDSQEPFDTLSPNNLVSSPSPTTTSTFLISHLKQHQNGRRPEISNEKPVLDENKKYYVR